MAKGFGKPELTEQNLLSNVAGALFYAAKHVGKPMIIPMFAPGNSLGLQPNQIRPGRDELPPDCDGLVLAVACSADDAQALIDLVANWQRQREGDRS